MLQQTRRGGANRRASHNRLFALVLFVFFFLFAFLLFGDDVALFIDDDFPGLAIFLDVGFIDGHAFAHFLVHGADLGAAGFTAQRILHRHRHLVKIHLDLTFFLFLVLGHLFVIGVLVVAHVLAAAKGRSQCRAYK